MVELLLFLFCVGAGAVGGVFLAFSSFVLRALAELPAAEGIAAMQRINVVVLNPVLLVLFLGTAGIGAVIIVVAFFPWESPRSGWWLAAGLLYVLGSFGVTVRCNVPRNNRLAGLGSGSTEAAVYWDRYVREWGAWNHVRTVASISAAGCGVIALAW